MMEIAVMLAFTAVLMICVIWNVSVVYALAVGYFIFCFYGLKKKKNIRELLKMSLSGMKTVKNVLIIFLLIGMITALWRAAGTIPVIICCSAKLIHPSAFIVITFLLNCAVSMLTGTSFGTSATMGVICMSMASAINISPLMVGGAIVSGVFFGDRCSPVSTSALLVSELTQTDLYGNIKKMFQTALIPFLAACAVYLLLGIFSGGEGDIMDVEEIFSRSFRLHWILMLPALMILVLAAFKVKVRITLASSILLSAVFCLVFQKIPAGALIKIMIAGYQAEDAEVAAMMNGGGVLSMIRVTLIVGISSCYAGIFEGTGLLNGMKRHIAALSKKITPFGSIMAVSTAASLIACNQTLATILTCQLCKETEPEREKLAIHLENTVIVIAPLVPWSIAGAVPIATVGAPMASLALACYLYFIPLWNLFSEWKSRNRSSRT